MEFILLLKTLYFGGKLLDPHLHQMIELYNSLDLPTLKEEISVQEVRSLMTQFSRNPLTKLQQAVAKTQDFFVSSKTSSVRVRGYYPDQKSERAPLLFFRGCGFVVPNFEDSDNFCLALAQESKRLVLSVDYPLAPEYPFPLSLEACLDVYLWAQEHCVFASLDPSEMILVGESSGGCLVALLSALIRDKGLKSFKRQVLLYPILDADFSTPSHQKYAEGYILTSAKVKWYLKHYLKNTPLDAPALPLRQSRFDGLPQTVIYSAEFDPLSSEADRYAEKLKLAQTPCELRLYPGMIHGFLKFRGVKSVDEVFKSLCASFEQTLKPLPLNLKPRFERQF